MCLFWRVSNEVILPELPILFVASKKDASQTKFDRHIIFINGDTSPTPSATFCVLERHKLRKDSSLTNIKKLRSVSDTQQANTLERESGIQYE